MVTYPPIVVCDAGDGEVGEQVDPDPVAIDILTDVYSRMRTRGGVPVDRQRTWRVGVELRAGSTGLAASDVDATSRHDNLRNLKRRIGTTVRCTDHDQACRAGHPGLGKRCKKPFTTKKQKQGKAQNFKPLQVQIARIKSSFISVPRSATRHKSLAKVRYKKSTHK